MTVSEALEIVIECGLNIEGIAHEKAMIQIVSALEKQIPRKVEGGYVFKSCPECGAMYSDNIYGKSQYCSRCGQKFDWSDENA